MAAGIALTTGNGSLGRRRRRRYASMAAGLAVVLGLTVLLGWYAGVPQITRLFTNWPAMQPLTAVSLILAGTAMLLQEAHRFRLAALPLVALVVMVGTTFFQYVTGHSLGTDALLFREAVLSQGNDDFPGRMRLMNAFGLVIFCLCMALPRKTRRQYRQVTLLATTGLVFPFATLCSYLLGAQGFNGLAGLIALSAPAALGQLLLFGGIVHGQRGRTWLQLLYSRTPGGRIARNLLPLILGWPLVVGFLINWATPAIPSPHQILALALVLVMVVLSALVLRFARRLDREVAARRASDAARRESEERYRLAVESAAEGIITIDPDSTINFANAAAAKIFGYSIADLLGTKLPQLLPERARAAYGAAMAEYFATGKKHGPWSGLEVTGLHRNGHEIPLEVSYVEFRQGGRPFFTGIIHDISVRKRADIQLRQLNDSLDQRVRLRTAELSRANEALTQSNQELQRFVYIASHDLQTPLRSITGFVQLLSQTYQGRLDKEADTWINLVVDNTHRLQVLIQELLAYSRAESDSAPFKPVDLNRCLKEVMAILDPRIKETAAEISCGALPTVRGNRIQLGQVLQHLIENALKYHGSEPPRIEIAATRQDNTWLFSVRDNGIGIAPKHHEKIFEVFRRLHTHQTYPGTGIGLAICRRVIQRHGGRIWVESERGKGSVFYFTLAVAEEDNTTPGGAGLTSVPPGTAAGSQS